MSLTAEENEFNQKQLIFIQKLAGDLQYDI